ncbi:MAG: RluA family pseudouridine synthase [Phycisphaeraceae bacterium]|nr:MAG: RluA family pseudouridine synthase [Phycisphaeraceae bacterium]
MSPRRGTTAAGSAAAEHATGAVVSGAGGARIRSAVETLGLEIVASGAGFVVVNKPPGLLSVPGKGEANQDCVASRVRAMFPDARGPVTVHRLDMETSGLIVAALDADSHRHLSRQFEARTVGKRYAAVLGGGAWRDDEPTTGEVRLPVRIDPDRRPLQVVDFEHGREAWTKYEVVGREAAGARVAFEPMTGRTHQLRVHAAYGLKRPIVGDRLYGGAPAPRLMLHAAWLAFDDPSSGARVEASTPTPF